MLSISIREFKNLFKSIRSFIIIAIMFGVTVLAAKMLSQFDGELQELGLDNAYMGGLLLLILILGPLFVTSLSHDIINREVHTRTVRFIVTKLSRTKIVLGKFIGVSLFWITCLTISLILIIPFSGEFYFLELIEAIIFITYFISVSLFLSSFIDKPGISMFLGIILSLAFPIVGIWAIASQSNIYIFLLSFITPYYYFGQENEAFIYFVPILSTILVLGSIMIFRKRDF